MLKKINKKIMICLLVLVMLLNITIPSLASVQIGDSSHLYGEKELPRFFRNKKFWCN